MPLTGWEKLTGETHTHTHTLRAFGITALWSFFYYFKCGHRIRDFEMDVFVCAIVIVCLKFCY